MKNLDLSLYLVTDDSSDKKKFLNTIEESIKGGVKVVQIREKTSDTLTFYNLALEVKKITDKYDIPLIINDRVDIALAIDADGVHVGQSDLPCDITRKLIGKTKILGISASTIYEAKKAQKEGADYIGTGAIFPTATKDDAPSVTKDELKNITESIDIPVVAIGGIKLSNVDEIKDCGIEGISVVSEIMDSHNPKKTSEELLERFNK
ncbi:MAG: thiamine phosphate synthase [Methanobrevibacter sp.]|nr:thiamine phosphate synthase [Methanobrevibacter sp.]